MDVPLLPSAAPNQLYQHWGSYPLDASSSLPEPNNIDNPEFCAVGNYSQRYGAPQVWAFADANCGIRAPFMCRISGGAGYQYNASTNDSFIFTPGKRIACTGQQLCHFAGRLHSLTLLHAALCSQYLYIDHFSTNPVR
jgi:hypothetical protein